MGGVLSNDKKKSPFSPEALEILIKSFCVFVVFSVAAAVFFSHLKEWLLPSHPSFYHNDVILLEEIKLLKDQLRIQNDILIEILSNPAMSQTRKETILATATSSYKAIYKETTLSQDSSILWNLFIGACIVVVGLIGLKF